MRKSALPPDYRARDAISARLRELRAALEADGVRHAAIFGSVARGDDVPESDVDIILDLDPAKQVGLFQFIAIQEFLQERLGRDVDLASHESLRPGRHDEILDDLFEVF